MEKFTLKIIKNAKDLIRSIKNWKSFGYFSQDGEDFLLSKIFETKPTGFYLDIGSGHPTKFSNSYYFYQKGWRGVCIDANADFKSEYKIKRPNDVFLNRLCGTCRKTKTYYVFDEPFLNTSSQKRKRFLENNTPYKLIQRKQISQESLGRILKMLDIQEKIDFMSLDVEGEELSVLQSNDWGKYSPKLIVVEILGRNRRSIFTSKICKYLESKKYSAQIILQRSVFFQLRA